MADATDFATWFEDGTGYPPRAWQCELAANPHSAEVLIRIPTGFGKTLGVLAAWAWHRLHLADESWPRRLVWCLPMRVLTEQTTREVTRFLTTISRLREIGEPAPGQAAVAVLMGGLDEGDWHLDPEECAVIIGTQDMLLSRVLNRGYGAPRARWPMEFGVLNHDCLWVMDEVQLMDVGLATSAQLQAFRHEARETALKPTLTWWMSATLQRTWLESVDSRDLVTTLRELGVPAEDRVTTLWREVAKPVETLTIADEKEWPSAVASAIRASDVEGLVLVILNTVDRASAMFAGLKKLLHDKASDLEFHLVHSRFRPIEREKWSSLLQRSDEGAAKNRVIVSTQVVEAGVDIDASLLITEMAPWPSLVQRFGRAARRGGSARVIVLDRVSENEKQARGAAAPYDPAELAGSRQALLACSDVAPRCLEDYEADLTPSEIASLYPYEPAHLILAHEWRELFDTSPDLSGHDLDIGRFIRSGDERDVFVFWRSIDDSDADDTMRPASAEICRVPFLLARTWLCGKGKSQLAAGKRAWVWSWLDGKWSRASADSLIPGRVVLVDAKCGGYSAERGFDPKSKAKDTIRAIEHCSAANDEDRATETDSSEESEKLSATRAGSDRWQSIGDHGADVADEFDRIAEQLVLPDAIRSVARLAARWHDYGKAHPAFQGSMRLEQGDRPDGEMWAKAPDEAWGREHLYLPLDDKDRRPGFRHEFASTLALFAILERHQPNHAALLGPWVELRESMGIAPVSVVPDTPVPTALEAEILSLSGEDFDLLAYLVLSHHGKVRTALQASPRDQDYKQARQRGFPIRGVCEDDELPQVRMGIDDTIPAVRLSLDLAKIGLSTRTGASWAERVHRLLDRHGPATLAFLEALIRTADIRASRAVSSPEGVTR